MKTSIYVLLAGLILFGLTACFDDVKVLNVDKVITVSDFPYTLKDKPAVIILLGRDNEHTVSVTMQREQIRPGYVSILPANVPIYPMSIDVIWGDKSYVMSTKHGTNAEFHIKRIDRSKRVATVTVTGRLVNPKDFSDFSEIMESTLEITGTNFDHLIM